MRLILPPDYRVCEKWVCNIGRGLGIIDLRIGGWIIELNDWMGVGVGAVRYVYMNWDRLGIRFLKSGRLFFLMNREGGGSIYVSRCSTYVLSLYSFFFLFFRFVKVMAVMYSFFFGSFFLFVVLLVEFIVCLMGTPYLMIFINFKALIFNTPLFDQTYQKLELSSLGVIDLTFISPGFMNKRKGPPKCQHFIQDTFYVEY